MTSIMTFVLSFKYNIIEQLINYKKNDMKKFAQKIFLLTMIPVKFICLHLFIFYIIFLCAIYGKQEVNSIETKPSEYH